MILTRQQRYAINAKDNPRGRNIGHGITSYPTHYQMNQFEKYGVVYDVDPALRDVVIELNARGYRTAGSCQGHNFRNKHGYVTIRPSAKEIPIESNKYRDEIYSVKKVNPHEIIMIFKKHGIIITKHTPTSFITKKIIPFYTFEFPVILDPLPIPEDVYFYKSPNRKLISTDRMNIPKGFHAVRLTSGITPDREYRYYRMSDNRKIVWEKKISAFDYPECKKLELSLEIQRVLHKIFNLSYNEIKMRNELTEGDDKLKKCKIKK